MDAFEQLETIARAMSDPAFYPHPVTRLERLDTHISTVFLTGDWVYKLKKPVNFGFLDFSSLAAREFFCRREVELNRRLSSGVYVGVEAVCRAADGNIGLGPGSDGPVLDYLVKMHQLPEAASLFAMAQRDAVGPAAMRALGTVLANFYRSGDPADELRRCGDPDLIGANVEDNFRQTEPFLDTILDRDRWEFIAQVSRSFLARRRRLFERRVDEGRIRDGHGDLRPDHVYFHQGIQIIDCIEFNDRFRYGDVAVDLAFLFMDLDRMGALEAGLEALAAYVAAADDPALYRLLDFYACYRAMVRVKVDCLRSGQLDAAARPAIVRRAAAYLEQAYRHAVQCARATLWLVCGLPASGKSTVAAGLAGLLEIPQVRSDALRRELGGARRPPAGVADYGEGLYKPHWKHQVYARMLGRAQESLREGRSIVLDATFAEARWRTEAQRLASDCDGNLIVVECLASEATLRRRLERRDREGSLSDARLQHLNDFRRDFEPLTELPESVHLSLPTERSPAALITELMVQAYRRQCLQVRHRLSR